MIAPDSATVTPSSVITGDLPSGWTRVSSGGASIVFGVALVPLDLVGNAELLEQPEDALRARVVEVVDGDHRGAFRVGGEGAIVGARVRPAAAG